MAAVISWKFQISKLYANLALRQVRSSSSGFYVLPNCVLYALNSDHGKVSYKLQKVIQKFLFTKKTTEIMQNSAWKLDYLGIPKVL